MTATLDTAVTRPGVYDMPLDTYLADPVPGGSLSCSGARLLLPPNCPAIYRWNGDHPQPPKRAFDFGHAAHREVLGNGPDLVVVDADDWRTKAAREARDQAYADGAVPLLAHEYIQVQDMAAALRGHRVAATLFHPAHGTPEQSMFWRDPRTEVWLRARLDWQPDSVATSGRLILVDYKTTAAADLDSIQRAVYDRGYYQQAAWYLDGAEQLGMSPKGSAFLFVFQQKTPPYPVTVVELDPVALRLGRERNQRAVHLYAECVSTDNWPGFHDDIATVTLPPWAENRLALEGP